MPAIQVMIKPVSGLCNVRCSYCFHADEMANRKQAFYGIMKASVGKTLTVAVNAQV